MKKNYITIKCPVCGHEVLYNQEGEDLIPHVVSIYKTNCVQCGYLYSDDTSDKKKLYEEYLAKVEKNPNYRWLDEDQPAEPHVCKVCGKYTFPDYQSFDICPYCSWEDDGYDDDGWQDEDSLANGIPFTEYKKNYEDSLKK